jgi:predicted ATPase
MIPTERSDTSELGRALRPPAGLPAYAGTFFGRDQLVDQASRHLASGAGVLTLIGPPGVGKTRLAVELARSRASHAGDAVVFVDARSAADETSLVYQLAQALDVAVPRSENADEVRRELARAALESSVTLVIIDNFEHLVPKAFLLVDAFIQEAPELPLIVTSRVRLGVEGEAILEVPPLLTGDHDERLSPGLAMLVERVRAITPGFEPSSTERASLARVAAALEGIPLALELIAPRIALVGVEAVESCAGQPLRLLERRNGRPAAGIHGSLRDALAWSWELLDETDRAALLALACFRSTFTLRRASVMLDLRDDPLAAVSRLESLVGASLLRRVEAAGPDAQPRGAEPSFALFASVREYALDAQASWASAVPAWARHLSLHVALATEDLERDDPHAAALHRSEVVDGVVRLLGSPERHSALLAEAIVVLEPMVFVAGGVVELRDLVERVLYRAELEENARACFQVLKIRGWLRVYSGDPDGAIEDHRRAATLAAALGDAVEEARATASIAYGAWAARRYDMGIETAAHALALARAAGDRRAEAQATMYSGCLHWAKDNVPQARRHYADALLLQRDIKSRRGELVVMANLVVAALDAGDIDEAERFAIPALAWVAERPAVYPGAYVLFAAALVDQASGRIASARTRHERAAELFAEVALLHFEGLAHFYRGLALVCDGEWDLAIRALVLSSARLERTPDRDHLVAVTAAQAIAEAAAGRPSAALAACGRAHALRHDDEPATRAILAMTDAFLATPGEGALAAIAGRSRRQGEPSLGLGYRGLQERLWPTMLHGIVDRASGGTATSSDDSTSGALTIARVEAQVRLPGGAAIDFSRRRGLLAVLVALASHERDHPGGQISADLLVGEAWPGEKVHTEAGRNRVRVAIAKLRKLGFDRYIVTDREGYRLCCSELSIS